MAAGHSGGGHRVAVLSQLHLTRTLEKTKSRFLYMTHLFSTLKLNVTN